MRPLLGTWPHNTAMCPDGESNPRPFGLQVGPRPALNPLRYSARAFSRHFVENSMGNSKNVGSATWGSSAQLSAQALSSGGLQQYCTPGGEGGGGWVSAGLGPESSLRGSPFCLKDLGLWSSARPQNKTTPTPIGLPGWLCSLGLASCRPSGPACTVLRKSRTVLRPPPPLSGRRDHPPDGPAEGLPP